MLLRYTVTEWGPLNPKPDDTFFSVMAIVELVRSPFAMKARQPARVWWIEFSHPTPRIERSSLIRDCDRGVKP